VALVLTCGCSGSTPPADATADAVPSSDGLGRPDGNRHEASLLDQGQPDASARDGAKVPDAGTTSAWAIVAESDEVAQTMGTMLTMHPSKPKTLAVKANLLDTAAYPKLMTNLTVLVSDDLGQTMKKVVVKSFETNLPGGEDTPYGFYFDPSNGQRLALLTFLMTAAPKPGPGPNYDSLLFATSIDGGASFSQSNLITNPWPPDTFKFGSRTKSLLMVRAQHVLYASEDLGKSLKVVFEDSKQCLAHGPFAVSPVDPDVFLLVCNSTLLRCEKTACSPAKLPAGFIPYNMEFSPHDASQVVVTGSNQVAASKDGGKTFPVSVTLSQLYSTRIVFDPRPGAGAIYVLSRGANKLYRSLDGGQSYVSISPPDLKLPLSTVVRDVDIAADGAVVAIAHPGIIRLPAP